MKTQLKLVCLSLIILAFAACKKDNNSDSSNTSTPPPPTTYASVSDFFAKSGVALQTYTINNNTGGSFTTLQGTVVTVPAGAFVFQSGGSPVSGNVTIKFKDLLKKSDLLLSGMTTTTVSGRPLKSGGEFFIQATADGGSIMLGQGKKIDVALPAALTGGMDNANAQQPWEWVNIPDSMAGNQAGWGENPEDSVNSSATSYIYSMFSFGGSAESGHWCNSDNETFFINYPTTQVTFTPTDDIASYNIQVFLVFKTINCMIHVYSEGNYFPYRYAPTGFECTMVALGVKDGSIYSAFVPVTITPNLSVGFTLAKTTGPDFIAALKALD